MAVNADPILLLENATAMPPAANRNGNVLATAR